MGVETVEGKKQFRGKCGASYCNQWGLCDFLPWGVATRLFSNYFGISCLCRPTVPIA